MEFVEGEPLDRLIRRCGRLEIKLALEIAAQVAAGLAAIYEQNRSPGHQAQQRHGEIEG